MNNNSNKTSTSSGIGFTGLKLTGKIAWSWWWVLSPIWIAALLVVLITFALLIIAIATA